MEKSINIKVKVWRQAGPKVKGMFETYELNNISTDASFLEMIDILNEKLVQEHKEPIAFDHDCREGICGMCSLYINRHPHGPNQAITTYTLGHAGAGHDGRHSSPSGCVQAGRVEMGEQPEVQSCRH